MQNSILHRRCLFTLLILADRQLSLSSSFHFSARYPHSLLSTVQVSILPLKTRVSELQSGEGYRLLMLMLCLTVYWQFQSNGWCHDHCLSDYAFAIVQGYNCWCSNYVPGITSSSSNCDTKCPGYDEFCGGDGFYGYIALNKAPLGTLGASDSAASSTPVRHPSPSRS